MNLQLPSNLANAKLNTFTRSDPNDNTSTVHV